MSKKIRELIEESVAKARLEGELAIASTVQQTLFPPPEFKNQDLHIYSHYQSATECGGDWWGFFGVGNKVSLLIADATGHGFPSALITAAARSCFSVMHKLAQEDPAFTFSPGSMLSYANRVVFDAATGKIMMTFFAGVIDFSEMTLTYANAAHNPPWLLQGGRTIPKLTSLVSRGPRLGEIRDIAPFEEKTVSISPGDVLFLYTDGLLEGKNLSDQMYGKKRTKKILESNFSKGPKDLLNILVKDFLKHNGSKPLDDDITLATAWIKPPFGTA